MMFSHFILVQRGDYKAIFNLREAKLRTMKYEEGCAPNQQGDM